MKLSTRVIIFLLGILFCTAPSYPNVKELNQKSSNAIFKLQSPFIPIEGAFTKISGAVETLPKEHIPHLIRLTIDLTGTKVGSSTPQTQQLFSQLLASLPSRNLTFISTSITKSSPSRLLVKGRLKEGLKEHSVSLPVDIVTLTSERAHFKGQIEGTPEFMQSTGAFLGTTVGSASFSLVFESRSS
jgi:hypothetical protein